jgi:hypothetical protein
VNINEVPLKTRLEAANEEFSRRYYRRVYMSRTGTRAYPSQELYKDLYACAGNHGLFAIALWAYFSNLHEHKSDRGDHMSGERLEEIWRRRDIYARIGGLSVQHHYVEDVGHLLQHIEELAHHRGPFVA